IGSLKPALAMAGGSKFTLTVDGVGFESGATVNWNGTALTTHFDDAEQLTADVPKSLVADAGNASVTVSSGGVNSNTAEFKVIGAMPVIGLLEPANAVAGGSKFTLTVTGGFGAGDFALQMVKAPERQSFTTE
ncbi:MAG: IPT/TIG domain-containing protein, partial [Nisaea sp.]|uniref:IPT/TIG domain-containing protein n=3 Tax=Nisaea sp. TaxID=2024842 RepID=UPI003267255D